MELLQKPQYSATLWSLLLSLFLIFNNINSLEATCRPLNLLEIKPENTTFRGNLIFPLRDEKNIIYLVDLERAIDHILRLQLLKVPVFKGNKLIVLKNIIALLHYLNPLATDEGKLYINNIFWSIQSQSEVTQEFLNTTINAKELLDKSYKGNDYLGCRGSESGLRDFNCSLWTLFHYLTVAASQLPECIQPGAVLWAFHGYTQYFMGCPECFRNLWFYAQNKQIDDVKTHDEEILWLWKAHNHFNRKLAGSISDDPFFAKKQFPPQKYCRRCRNFRGEWRTNEVLKYLKSIYGLDKLYYQE
ncbi:sulfhydryl oxidase 2-like [Drosophila serrata]|uniref:sulfhydryl oxidase 2-like n=1 Tax=Drosophila serrata TaxID=7274 RepID=UPI000A1D0A0B|nr:sulfhydryl oxidase 2-like [Drosophila serrata]